MQCPHREGRHAAAAGLESGDTLLLHLRMTGCLLAAPPEFPKEKHTHVVFQLSDGKELRFSDTRRFGRFWLIGAGEADPYSGIGKLGSEPFAPDCTAEYLFARFGKRKKAIKECLMEQSVIAGIGNIYSDEILFAAGLHPARAADSLTGAEWERLAALIPERLSFFIAKNAITPEEYLQTKGRDYRNTPFLQVYGHAGDPCPVCGTTLCRTVIGGRSSVYCPPLPEIAVSPGGAFGTFPVQDLFRPVQRSGCTKRAIVPAIFDGHSDIGVTLTPYTHLGYDDAKEEWKRLPNGEWRVVKWGNSP